MKTKPFVLTIDDDEAINKLIGARIQQLGAVCKTTSDSKSFLEELIKTKPYLCIIDLYLTDRAEGLELIEEVRRIYPEVEDGHQKRSSPYIVVLSGNDDEKLISHAIELGADDYLLKTPNRFFFQEKISKYLKPKDEVEEMFLRTVPDTDQSCKIGFDVQVCEITEYGLKIKSENLLAKGTFIYLDAPELLEATSREKAVPVTIVGNWMSSDENCFYAVAEFDLLDEKLARSVRHWILKKRSG